MYHTIVVGTDGSDTAAIAVRHALELAAANGATLHVVHAHQNVSLTMAAASAGSGGPPLDLDRLETGLQEHGQEVVAAVAADAQKAGVEVRTHVVSGEPADALVTVADTVHADLVVVGSRGLSGLRRFVLGSVPNRVAHHCPCSLLIVNTATP